MNNNEETKEEASGQSIPNQADILRHIKTPLILFGLIVLVTGGMFLVFWQEAQPDLRRNIIYATTLVLALIICAFVIILLIRPESLQIRSGENDQTHPKLESAISGIISEMNQQWGAHRAHLDKALQDSAEHIGKLQYLISQDFNKCHDLYYRKEMPPALRKFTRHYWDRLLSIHQKDSFTVKNAYDNLIVITKFMEMTEYRFVGFTSVIDEWKDQLGMYYDVNKKKISGGLPVTRYFFIGKNADTLKFANEMERQKSDKVLVYYLFHDEVAHFLGELLDYVEYGLFQIDSETSVLCYRRGSDINSRGFEMTATWDKNDVSSKDIFNKLENDAELQKKRTPFSGREQFLGHVKSRSTTFSGKKQPLGHAKRRRGSGSQTP